MLDEKQEKLIRSWRVLADQQSGYNAFIARWIAFNAYCYALYAPRAQRQRADLRTSPVLTVSAQQQSLRGTLVGANNRVTIDIEAPTRLKIVIRERYTEDYIFDAFAKEHEGAYKDLLMNDMGFREAANILRSALEKRPGEFFVVNMAKATQHKINRNLNELANENVIVRLTDLANLRQMKDVLYQIRCNIFHGEKVPDDLNDDRITNAAAPVLGGLLTMVAGPLGA